MKLHEVRELLAAIAGFDRRPFPPGAEVTWHEMLVLVDAEDAHKAMLAYYANKDASGPISPGELRAGAAWYADRRRRSLRELPAAPVVTERSAAARAAARRAAHRAVTAFLEAHPDHRPRGGTPRERRALERAAADRAARQRMAS